MPKCICVCAAALGLSMAGPAFAQSQPSALPSYEMMGMPISPVQMQVLGSAHVRERSAVPTQAVEGMPASPHQATVLAPRRKPTVKAEVAR